MDTTEENADVTVDQNNTDFDAAFDDASAEPGAEPAAKPAVEESTDENPDTGGEPNGASDSEPAGDEQPDGSDPKPDADPEPEPTPAPSADAKPEPAAPQPGQLDPKFLAQAIAEAQAEREAQNKPAPEQEAKPLTRADFLNEADAAAVKKFETEWPDEYQAVQKLMQAELRAAIGNSFNDYTKQLNGVLAPLMGSVQKAEVNTYKGAVTAAHPDAFEIAPRVAEWIATQPSFVRSAYQQAYNKGTAQEAIELLNLYKQATGSTGAAPATPASSAAQEPPKPKPAVDRKAAAALAAVPAAQRPKPTGGADILDFDGAFEEAAGKLANS